MGTRNGKVFLSDEYKEQGTQEMNDWSPTAVRTIGPRQPRDPVVRGKGQAGWMVGP